MLAACRDTARWIDVFCDRGAFDVDEARFILQAGIDAGLMPRLHAGQLGPGDGIRLAVDLGAASVDHCTYATDADIDALAAGDTVATLLPGAEFSTRATWPDARRFLDAGVTVALATDCNPGSSYTTSMALLHRGGRARHGLHARRGGVGGDRRRGGRAAPRRRRRARASEARGLRPARRTLLRSPGLPARRAALVGDVVVGGTGVSWPS